MKRVAVISMNGSSGGGIESVVRWQIEVLQAKGCLVKLVSAPFLTSRDMTSNAIRKLAAVIFPWLSPFVARAWAGRSGVVISHGWSSIGLGCDVVFAHGCWHRIADMWGVRQSLYSRLVCLYEGLAARLGKRVVCVSDGVMSDVIEHYGALRSRMEVMHNTCDTTVFTTLPNKEATCPVGKINVLFVGRLEPWKGLNFIAELSSEIRAVKDCDVSLTICTPTIPAHTDSAKCAGADIRTGVEAHALCRLYNSAHLVILPSQYESFEMATIEALCCGTPVMLNDTGTRPYLLESGCPAVYCLDPTRSPLEQVLEARKSFSNIDRAQVSSWARSKFAPDHATKRLLLLVGVQ
jgi:glycosyltransferase involved in cell wall biosynthesis